MIIEVLYKELYAYGETGNIAYLEQMFAGEEFIYTSLLDRPYFADHKPDLIIIEPIADHYHDALVGRLGEFREQLLAHVEDGVYFIAFGEAIEYFGKQLTVDGVRRPTLELFGYTSEKHMRKRQIDVVCAQFRELLVLGNHLSFTEYRRCDDAAGEPLYEVKAGIGFTDEKTGGYRYKNAFMVEMLGNLFMYNPLLSRKLLAAFGRSGELPFQEYAFKCYNERLSAWKKQGVL